MLRKLFGAKKPAPGPKLLPTRTSYSIEAEDLLLESLFLAVLKKYTPGTYLDLGAAHPINHSNTYKFYCAGWRGICVEPNPDFFSLYASLRPGDRAINIGVSDRSGLLKYHRFTEPLINGFFGQDLIDAHKSRGEVYLGSADVPCVDIKEFLAREVSGKEIDLLNIDVETLDALILKNWDWSICRPKLICAEIHTSTIKVMLQTDVATILEAAGYSAVSRGWMSTIFMDNAVVPSM